MESSIRLESCAAFEALPEAVLVVHSETGTIRYANERARELYQSSSEALLNTSFASLNANTPPYTVTEMAEWIRKAAVEGPQTFEWSIQNGSGEGFWAEINLKRAVLEGQDQLLAVVHDITKLRHAYREQEALRESEAKFRRIVQQAPFCIEIYGLDGTMLDANHAWENLYHVKIEDVAGNFNILLDEQIKNAGMFEAVSRAFAGEYVQTKEFLFDPAVSGQPGRARWLIGNFFPLRNDQGEIIYMISSEMDVTNQKEAELRHQQNQQEVIAAQQSALKELATPIIPIMDQIIVMPLVGNIDSLRARDLTRTLLDGISRYRARIVILDVTGVPLVDSGVAGHLNKTIQAARLKGARAIVTGISDAVAETIVDLGIDWSEVETLRDLQSGLLAALKALGFTLAH